MHTLTQWPAMLVAIAALNSSCGGDGSSPIGPSGPTTNAPPASNPLPSTFAGKIVFARVQGRTNVIMAMNAEGGGQVNLKVQGWTPDVSPDGLKVAYITPNEDIGVLDLTSGKESIVAPRFSVSPKWSPDGRKILFWSDRSGSKELWTMNADGSGAAQLTGGGGGYHEADWSPDGTRIVFRRVLPGSGGGDLWMMNADGTDARLFYAGDRMDSDPRWSPDGKRIAFVRIVPKELIGGTTSEIFVINADGSNLIRLTDHPGEDWAPRWSPDGSGIVFFGFRTSPDDPDLFTVRPDATGLTVLLGGPTYDHGATYGPAN